MRRASALLAALLIVLAQPLAHAACPCPCMRPAADGATGSGSSCGTCCGSTHRHGPRPAPAPVPKDRPDPTRCECQEPPSFAAEPSVEVFDAGRCPSGFADDVLAPSLPSSIAASNRASSAGDTSHVPRCTSSATPAALPVLRC